MKKLLSVLLSLMLLMPAAALAQTAEETVTVDFDDFTLELGANDVYETGEKVSNKVLVQVYADYDPNAGMADNFNIVWSDGDITVALDEVGIEAYARAMMEGTAGELESMGLALPEYRLIDVVYENGVASVCTYMIVDYSGIGYPIQTAMYQLQVYLPQPDASTYVITFTSATEEGLNRLTGYLDAIVFK